MSRLKEKYHSEVVPAMIEEFGYATIMAVPRLTKVVLNMGLGEATQNIKMLDAAVEELTLIAGQRAVVTKARKSIAGFKLREGMPIGCTVTLRRERMYDFLDKLFNAALARVRDFRGISGKIFDGRANCSIGIKDFIVFPEIDYDKIDKIKGLNISIVTTAQTDAEGRFLLEQMGMPFRH
ncbi:MAG: 50S ribosomal protein L5 [Desulfobacteraceae bacterium]